MSADRWKGYSRLDATDPSQHPHRHFFLKGTIISLFVMLQDGEPIWRSQREWTVFEKMTLDGEIAYGADPSAYGKTMRSALASLRMNIMKLKKPELMVVDNMLRYGKQQK